MGFSCCASIPIFWFAAPEVLTLILLLPHNLCLIKSRFNILNSCSHGGLTSILLLHPCTEDRRTWKGQGNSSVDLPPRLLIAGALLQLAAALSAVLSWSPGNKPEGLVHTPVSLEGSSWLQNTQGCRRFSPPSLSTGRTCALQDRVLFDTDFPPLNQKLLNNKAKLEIVNNSLWWHVHS